MNRTQALLVLGSLQRYMIQLKKKVTDMQELRKSPDWKNMERNRRHMLNQVIISKLHNTEQRIRVTKIVIKKTQQNLSKLDSE